MILQVKHTSSITQVKQEVDYEDFKVFNIKEVTVWEAFFGISWNSCSPVEERCHCTGKILGQKALKADVELA